MDHDGDIDDVVGSENCVIVGGIWVPRKIF